MDGVSTDTAFAIGEALGTLGKAKGLVGRDIDQGQIMSRRRLLDRRDGLAPILNSPRHLWPKLLAHQAQACVTVVDERDDVAVTADALELVPVSGAAGGHLENFHLLRPTSRRARLC